MVSNVGIAQEALVTQLHLLTIPACRDINAERVYVSEERAILGEDLREAMSLATKLQETELRPPVVS
jgi:hypothetical protein